MTIKFLKSLSANSQSAIRIPNLLLLLGVLLLYPCLPAQAQQGEKIPRIGYLAGSSPSGDASYTEALRQGLRKLGYVEEKNIVIESRHAEGKLDRLPALAAELVRLKVDIIVTPGPIVTRAVKDATTTIPIVMYGDPDPVATGFVTSLARPGGNITGLYNLAPELSGKRLELLKEVIPKLSRVAVFGTSTFPGNAQALKEIELAAAAFKVQLQSQDVLIANDMESAFRAAGKGRAEAVLFMVAGGITGAHRSKIAELAV